MDIANVLVVHLNVFKDYVLEAEVDWTDLFLDLADFFTKKLWIQLAAVQISSFLRDNVCLLHFDVVQIENLLNSGYRLIHDDRLDDCDVFTNFFLDLSCKS